MTFEVFHNYDSGVTFVTGIVAIPICVGVTALRLLQAYVGRVRKRGLEDLFAVLALLTFLVYASGTIWTMRAMNGKDVFKPGALPESTVIKMYKVGYVTNLQEPLNQTFAKLSLLALYYRLFNVNYRFVQLVWVVGGVQVSWGIAMVLVRLFECSPVEGGWNPTIKRTCLNNQIILASGDAINSFLDFVIIGMAIWMIEQLRMNREGKLKLGLIFAIGGFSGIIGIIRIAQAYGKVGVNTVNATWLLIQQTTSIICCCAPIYKTLLHKSILGKEFWSRLTSWTSSIRSHHSRGSISIVEHKGSEATILPHRGSESSVAKTVQSGGA